jgi:hypothetical protein
MKDMRGTTYVLGIRISRDKCKPLSTRVSRCQHLSKKKFHKDETEIKEMETVPYAQAVSSLMYAMTSTRPNIFHAIGLVNKYQSNPRKTYWQAIKQIFKYLQGTKNMGLYFGLCDLEIARYANADFVGDLDDRKLTNGYVFLFDGTASYLLVKQKA